MAKDGQLRDLERELAHVNQKISQCRLEKELLEWEKTRTENSLGRTEGASANSETVGEVLETPRRPGMPIPLNLQAADSEVRFKVHSTPKFDEETTGYVSELEADTIPMRKNVTFAPLTPQQHATNPFSPTPIDLHVPQCDMNQPMPINVRTGHIPVTMSKKTVSDPVKRQRPLLVPDRYDGKTAWREYRHHFDACKDINGWEDAEAASFLMASLQGEALRCVSGLSSEVRCSYRQMILTLGRRFDSSQQAENYLMELRHRKQGPRESLQELGQAIHELSIKAYPEIPATLRERLEKNHYIDAVESQSIREGIMSLTSSSW